MKKVTLREWAESLPDTLARYAFCDKGGNRCAVGELLHLAGLKDSTIRRYDNKDGWQEQARRYVVEPIEDTEMELIAGTNDARPAEGNGERVRDCLLSLAARYEKQP